MLGRRWLPSGPATVHAKAVVRSLQEIPTLRTDGGWLPRRVIFQSSALPGRVGGVVRLAAAALLAMPTTGTAAPVRYNVDVTRSRVDFKIRYLGIFMLGGQFNGVVGTAVFDSDRWETLAVGIRVPVNGLETRPSFWRGELLGPHFFDSAHYPAIEFSTTRTARTGNGTADAWGNLTVRSVTRPVLLKARVGLESDAVAVTVEAEAQLQLSAFGLGGVVRFASDDVAIVLHLRMVPAEAARQTSGLPTSDHEVGKVNHANSRSSE